jgi:hypothetical protein
LSALYRVPSPKPVACHRHAMLSNATPTLSERSTSAFDQQVVMLWRSTDLAPPATSLHSQSSCRRRQLCCWRISSKNAEHAPARVKPFVDDGRKCSMRCCDMHIGAVHVPSFAITKPLMGGT